MGNHASSQKILLTVLNSMAGNTIERAFDQHSDWGLRVLDLKDGLFGKAVAQLSIEEARTIDEAARERHLKVHTLSTGLFFSDVERGEKPFRESAWPLLENTLQIASVLMPVQIRLLSATSSNRDRIDNAASYLSARHPWVFDVYLEAIDRIADTGVRVVIENELGNNLFSTPEEIVEFFSTLSRTGRAWLTWDIQNLWQMGTFPTLDVYQALKPIIGMVHVKGGRAEEPGGPLKWRSHLDDASWPVVPILKAVVADGVSPVICLNPSHGQPTPGFVADYGRDLDFLRREIPEIE